MADEDEKPDFRTTAERILEEYLKNPPPVRQYNPFTSPLRRGLDYSSVGRKTFLVDDLGFICEQCGFRHQDKNYVHSNEECTVHGVMDS